LILARHGDGYVLDDDPGRLDRDVLEQWLSHEAYWALGRTRKEIDASIAGSWPFGVFDNDAAMVGFARVITDRVTFAWLCDVFVAASVRGRGVGTWMVAEVAAAVRATGVPRQVLATRDAHEVYATSGFTPLAAPERWMEIDTRPTR
jgi:GNAT superfamily N-acetyltransferase